MVFEIYDGYSKDGGERRVAVKQKAFQDEEFKEEYGRYPIPEDYFCETFQYEIVKVGEIKVSGDSHLLYDQFPVDGDV